MPDKYAVFGNPIEHSKSPNIHRAFANQTGQVMGYNKQLVDVDGFVAAADQFFQSGGRGLNVTAPFKLDAYGYASRTTARARRAGAINTLAMQADGTSSWAIPPTAWALVRRSLLRTLAGKSARKRVLISGGRGCGARYFGAHLGSEQPQHVVIANRSVSTKRCSSPKASLSWATYWAVA